MHELDMKAPFLPQCMHFWTWDELHEPYYGHLKNTQNIGETTKNISKTRNH